MSHLKICKISLCSKTHIRNVHAAILKALGEPLRRELNQVKNVSCKRSQKKKVQEDH